MPERYNIAADVCDKHPRDKPAMVWERFDGARREVTWGELQDLSNQAANVLRDHGVERGERVAVVLPPTPETAAVFFGTWKNAGLLLSMSVLYGDDGIAHRLRDSQPRVLVTDKANAARFDPSLVGELLVLDDGLLDGASTEFETADTAADDPAQLYYTCGTTGLAKGIVHAHRYLLAHEEFVYCHEVQDGERFHGMGEWAWAAGHRAAARAVAPGRDPGRPAAQGRLRPRPAARLPQPPRGHERLHHAHRDAGDDGHRGRRHPLPAEVPARVLGGRAAQPRGDPLVPRAVRAHRARLLRAHRVLSARAPTTRSWRSARARWAGRCPAGTCRSSTRTSSRSPRASAARSACARARTRTIRSATGATRRPRRRPSAATGSTPRTPRRRTRTATSGTRAAPTT